MLPLFEAGLISFYLNMCFLVAEIAVLKHGPDRERRHQLDMMAHILTGPITFLAFLNGGFMGSIAFFAGLWHFLCDSGRARPSLIFVRPCSRAEFWVWFESLWLLIHHIFTGSVKLIGTELAVPGTDLTAKPIRFYVRFWLLGATLSHLSFGMSALKLSGATAARVASVLFRMGSALLMAAQFDMQFKIFATFDLCWMTVILLLTLRKAVCSSPPETDASDRWRAAEEGDEAAAGTAAAAANGRTPVLSADHARCEMELRMTASGTAPSELTKEL